MGSVCVCVCAHTCTCIKCTNVEIHVELRRSLRILELHVELCRLEVCRLEVQSSHQNIGPLQLGYGLKGELCFESVPLTLLNVNPLTSWVQVLYYYSVNILIYQATPRTGV